MALEQRSDSYSEILRREVTFSRLALALTRDYLSVYYVNMLDNSYVEYAATGDGERLNVLSEGSDFFADMVTNCRKMVHLEDQERFFTQMNKDSFNRVIRTGEAFTMDYRLMINGTPVYYKLKVTRISRPPRPSAFIVGAVLSSWKRYRNTSFVRGISCPGSFRLNRS